MAELKVDVREWHFLLDFEPGEVPSVKKQYTSKLVYQPHRARIKVIASANREPRLAKVDLYGYRVTKDGPGAPVSEDFYSSERMPEWLRPHIDLAVMMAQIELDK
jgi:hypothetical protein